MLRKRFAITLIILTTVAYANVFVLARIHGTGFFDEILNQINRFGVGFSHKGEIAHSRMILHTILTHDHPPAEWNRLMAHQPASDLPRLFYFYKVWSVKAGLTPDQVNGCYPIFKAGSGNRVLINIRYGKSMPVLRFPFHTSASGTLTAGLFYAVNELPFNADLNADKQVTFADVILARKGS